MRQDLNETNTVLSLKDYRQILDSYNFKHVALHGWGEPLLNPELFQMVKYAESKEVSTELTTNATLLQRNIEKIFASGLSSIAFGIHNKENLHNVIPQINDLITKRNKRKLERPKTYVDIVIYRGNHNEIPELIETSADLNVDAVVLHRVFSIYKADPEAGYISLQEEKGLFAKVTKTARKLKLKVYLPPQPSITCRAVKHSIFVTSEGEVTPCPYFAEFYMGDALNRSIREIIYSERYRDFIRNMLRHPVCSRCPLGSTSGKFYS